MEDERDGSAPAGTEAPEGPSAPGTQAAHDPGLRVTANPLLRGLYRLLGLIFVAFAVVGVLLPGWPTTVWLIVATFFFARSSPRFYRLLLDNRVFGPLIRDFRAGRGIPARAKLLSISMIVVFAGSSAALLIEAVALRVLVALAGLIGVVYVWRLPVRRE